MHRLPQHLLPNSLLSLSRCVIHFGSLDYHKAVLVPFEGGCMAREHYWPTGSKTAQDQEKRALAAEHDRQVRNRSVANDIRLDLPVSVARPDGEEHPARARFRSHDKRYEIQKPYIQGPPNVTVLDCLERTVTQPSSSSRSGGSKSTSKSSSSHWGLSWSRSNKSPPSRESRTRGQQRHPHPSNPSTSVRQQNAPSSSSCETARNSGGVAQGLLAGPSLFSTLSSSSNSSSSSSSSSSSLGGGNPNSSLLGFHRAATSLVAGDNVHSAFPLHHHHHHHPSTLSHHEPPPTNSTNPARCKQQHQQPLSYPGGGSIAEKFSEKVQHCTNALVGSARTSPNNNNSSSASTSTAGVLSRLIDPDSKLFRSSSKDSKRSSNGKNGKSHRTDQSSSSASSSPGGSSSSLVNMVDCGGTIHHYPDEQQQQHHYHHHHHHQQQQHPVHRHHEQQQQLSQYFYGNQYPVDQMSHHLPIQMPIAGVGSSSMQQSCSVPTSGNFFASFDDRGGDNMMMRTTHLPRSLTPDNNNSCSSGSRSSRSGPSSSSNPVVRMDAYCSGADPGANITDSDRGELFDEGEEKKAAQQVAHRYNMMPGSKSNNHEGESMESSGGGVHNLHHHHHHHHPHHPGTSPSVFSDCENGNARVPPVATIGQCGVVRDSNDSTLKLSPSSSPGQVADEYDMIPRDEEMKGGEEQQQQPSSFTCSVAGAQCLELQSSPSSPSASFINNSHHVHMSSVPSSSSLMFNCRFNPTSSSLSSSSQPPAAALPRVPPAATPTATTTSVATVAGVGADSLGSSSTSSCCSVNERKRSDDNTSSSSGCSTDPNYSTFAKVNNNNVTSTSPPASVQSQYLDSSSTTHRCNTISSMDTSTSSRANENNNFPPSPHFDSAMMSESSTRVHNRNGANNTPCAGSQEGVEATRSANQYSTMNMIKSEGGADIAPAPSPRNDPTSTVDDDDDNATSSKNLIVTANTTTTTSVRETAHHCELSETFIASKNDTDQYCTAAAAELITSLHSSSSSSSPCSSSSASALSIQQSSSSYPSSSSLAASHQAHADSVQSAEFDTQPPPPSPLNRIT